MSEINNNNNIFKFILDYFNKKKINKSKYKEFLKNYNVLNLLKLVIQFHYDFLIYYLNLNNLYCNETEIFVNLQNLENKLQKFYNLQEFKIPTFNFFIFSSFNLE